MSVKRGNSAPAVLANVKNPAEMRSCARDVGAGLLQCDITFFREVPFFAAGLAFFLQVLRPFFTQDAQCARKTVLATVRRRALTI